MAGKGVGMRRRGHRGSLVIPGTGDTDRTTEGLGGTFSGKALLWPQCRQLPYPPAPSDGSSAPALVCLLVAASGPMIIFKAASVGASGTPTELWMALHGCLTGISNLAGPQHNSWAPSCPHLRKWRHCPPSCSSPSQGVILGALGPCVGSTASQGWGLCLEGTSCLLLAPC